MKKIIYVSFALALIFVTTHITHALDTKSPSTDIATTMNAGDVSTYREIQKPVITQPIFEKQKWDENRLNLLKEVLKQENIGATRVVVPTTKIVDFTPEVKEFQKKYNLPQTGTVGPLTTQALNSAVTRQLNNTTPQTMPIEKSDFYRILVELPCLNGKKLVTDCTSTDVTPEMIYKKKDEISTWLGAFERTYRELNYRNLVTQIKTVQTRDQVIQEVPAVSRPGSEPRLIDPSQPRQTKPSERPNICGQKGPTLEELNQACPLGYNTQLGECNTSPAQSTSGTQCALGFNPWKNACNQAHNPGRNNSDGSDSTPRVMFWCGKVNQYWNLDTKRFETDPDGTTGGEMLDPLSYCKKMYPQLSITQAQPYKRELSQNWAQAGNMNNWTSMLMSYSCK